MIKELIVKNYALIDELELTPSPKLNIVTGETGAGKSIILGAIGLLLGNRSDSKALMYEEKKCVVEGIFNVEKHNLDKFFKDEKINFDSECIIRREINSSGKSRAFINDTPVHLGLLKELGSKLIDIHSQHESLQLHKRLYQLNVLDAFAAHDQLLEEFKKKFELFSSAKKKLDELTRMANKSSEDAEYKQYLLTELQEIALENLDQKEAEKELGVLENAEEILTKLSHAQQLTDGSETSISQTLTELKSTLNPLTQFSGDLKELASRVESQYLEFQDIGREITLNLDRIEYNPERIFELKNKLDTLYRLQTKHKVNSVEELLEIQADLNKQLSLTTDLDDQITKAEEEVKITYESMMSSGEILTESRKLSALDLSAEIEKIIQKIGIENGQVEIEINRVDPTHTGLDKVNILFSANKGIEPEDISQVASGGEFSRLIFAIKYLIAGKKAMPSVIFDEIDTGISGEVALKMVEMMQDMAENHQVLAISHLPQFAAGGDAHYYVYKDNSSDRSVSKIKQLEEEDRIREIAKMIGGNTPSDSAFSSARELLGIG